jgi:hypothetical protein
LILINVLLIPFDLAQGHKELVNLATFIGKKLSFWQKFLFRKTNGQIKSTAKPETE